MSRRHWQRRAGLLPVLLLAATAWGADAALLRRGEAVYERCMGCHSIEQNRTGPAHCGLFGRKAGTAPGYDAYTPAMKNAGWVWDEQTLARFLGDPMKVVPGTSMTYQGVSDPRDREALVAWLREATQVGKACRLGG